MNKGWRWYSTPESADALIPSVLALVETVVAVGAYLWIATHGHTLHLVIAALVAPLLLLRTDLSDAYAVKTLDAFRLGDALEQLPENFRPHPIFGYGMMFPYLLFAKVSATVLAAIQAPIRSIKAIPLNWWRYVGCIDSAYPLEPIPGVRNHADRVLRLAVNPGWVIGRSFKMMLGPGGPRDPWTWSSPLWFLLGLVVWPIGALILLGPPLLFLALPAFMYRLSLKGTSIIYLPLLWIVRTATGGTIWERVRVSATWAIAKVRLLVAALVLAFLASKILFQTWWQQFRSFVESVVIDPAAIDLFIAPTMIPKWQLAAGINGMLAWGTFLWVDFLYQKHKHETSPTIHPATEAALRTLWTISLILSLYTISIAIYNALQLHWSFPPIGRCWTPWWCGART